MKIVIDIDTGLTGTDHALRALRAMSDTIAGPAEVILDSGQHTFVVTEIAGIVDNRREAFALQRGETVNVVPLGKP